MARNAEALIGFSIASLQWVDGIYLYDDNSMDSTVEKARQASTVPLIVEYGRENTSIFKRGEMEARNTMTDKAFEKLGCDVLVLVDSDELMSELLKTVIFDVFSDPRIDSLCFSIWHLFDQKHYLHFWETYMNGVYLIDPHIRVIRRHKRYLPGFADGSHPFIKTTDFTRCLHGCYHFHLKYHQNSPYPNYALNFLPKYPTLSSVKKYLRKLPFPVPDDIQRLISNINWESLNKQDLDYYEAYKTPRINLSSEEALVHPRDKNEKT